MAEAAFDLRIRALGGTDGAALRVGDTLEATLYVVPEKDHSNVKLSWEVIWEAEGRTTDRSIVGVGVESLGAVRGGEVLEARFRAKIPPTAPVSYAGHLFQLRWLLRASLDLPWALDPEDTTGFLVVPRPASQ